MSTLILSEQLTADTPSVGKQALYMKADGQVYSKDAAGVESLLNATSQADALALKISLTEKGAANGVATLDAGSKIPAAQLPSVAITDAFPVASQEAQVALTAEVGDVAIRTDQNLSYILMAEPASVFANWLVLLSPTDSVTSVAGKTGVVTLTKADVGLGNVDNTSDATKQDATNALLAGGTLPIAATTLSASGALTTAGLKEDAAGNLGLEVTPSAWVGFKAMQIGRNSLFANPTQSQIYVGSNSYYDGSVFRYIDTAASSYVAQGDGDHSWYTAPSGTAGNPITFTQAMTLDASGNLSNSGSHTIGSFTVATRPAHAAGKMIYVSDGGAGAVYQGSDGSAWVNLG